MASLCGVGDVVNWEQYFSGCGLGDVLRPRDPGIPYAVFRPPMPLWLVRLPADNTLRADTIVLLRERTVHRAAYRAAGGEVGEHYYSFALEFTTEADFARIFEAGTGHIWWRPIFSTLEAWQRYDGQSLGIAVGAYDPAKWQAAVDKVAELHARREAKREKVRQYALARKARGISPVPADEDS